MSNLNHTPIINIKYVIIVEILEFGVRLRILHSLFDLLDLFKRASKNWTHELPLICYLKSIELVKLW